MNQSSNHSVSLTLGLERAELWVHIIVFYLILCGIFSTIGYFMVFIGISRAKHLKTHFFIILRSLVLCRALLCTQFFVIGVYRILRTLEKAPSEMPPVTCNGIQFWLLVGLTLEMTHLLILVLEQAIAVMFPLLYRLLTIRQAVICCAVLYVMVIILKVPFAFADMVPAAEVPCINSYSAPSDQFNNYSQNIDLAILLLTLVVYGVLMGFVRHKISVLRAKGTYNTDCTDSIALKRQLELMPTLRHLVLLHCGLSLVSRILRASAGMVDEDNNPYLSARLSAYGGLFTTIDLLTNLVALLFGNEKVRKATLGCCTKIKVGDANTVVRWKWAKTAKETPKVGKDEQRGNKGPVMANLCENR